MILVTGGTGLVGAHLLYFLLKEGTPVRAIHRKDSNLNSVKNILALYTSESDILFDKIQWMEADITDIPALTKAFEDVTYVYHCAAIIDFNPSSYRLLKKINVEGTANIVNFCLAKNVKKLCYVSSVSAFGSAMQGNLIDETTYWNPDERNDVYSITKYGAEMEVWRGTQEGLDAVIVNPSVILGISPSAGGSGTIIDLGARGIPFYPTGGGGIVDVQDVVRAMILLMNSDIKNQQYLLVGENIYYRDLLTQLANLFGKKPPKRKLSKSFMFFLSSMDWLFSNIFGSKRKVVKATVRSMFNTSFYDTSKIKKELDFEFTPTKETLERIAAFKTSI